MKENLLTKAIAGKGISSSWNTVNKFKVSKSKPEKPELSNPSTAATYTVAISSIHSSVVSENKQEDSTQSNMANASNPTTPTISTPEFSIDFDVNKTSRVINSKAAENSESDKPKSKQTKLSFYFSKKWILFFLFLLCK